MTVRAQISAGLRRRIVSGDLHPNSPIPSERELAEELGVSRMTVRAALDDLVNEGLLVKHQGRKTLVATPKIAHGTAFMSFTEDMRMRGWQPRSEVRQLTTTEADVAVAAQLNINVGSKVLFLERVRFADDEPLALERVYLPFNRFQRLMTMDLARESLYQLMEREFETRPVYAAESIEAILLSPADAELFELPIGSPALLTRRVTRDDKDSVIEAATTLYRGDRYCMVLARRRYGPSAV